MKVIGLTGILGCGKSTVAKMLEEKGAQVVDMDQAGKWVVEHQPKVLDQLCEAFGDDIVDHFHRLKKGKLAEIVFSDRHELQRLNAIVHPSMLVTTREWIERVRSGKTALYCIVDSALLFEVGFEADCNAVVLVRAPLEQCLSRAETDKGLSREQALKRMAMQWSQEKKGEHADYVLDNDETIQMLKIKVHQLHDWIRSLL